MLATTIGAIAGLLFIYSYIIHPLFISSIGKVPGLKLYALTKWRLAWEDFRGRRTRSIHSLHQQYGAVVRIGPNEVHFSSLSALRKIYGAGSGFERTSFYRMFDVYGRQNLFTLEDTKRHGDRKKLLANAYSKSFILQGNPSQQLAEGVQHYLDSLEELDGKPNDVFETLHYFSIDSITNFLYGPKLGGTSAVSGDAAHRALLHDIHDPSRRNLSWFAVHLPALTKWLYTRSGPLERVVKPFLPMQKPATYTAIRAHALQAMKETHAGIDAGHIDVKDPQTIIGRLYRHRQDTVKTQSKGTIDDLDIASECADHLLAGIDTTADTLTFLFWALSLPQNKHMQQRLIDESKSASLDQDLDPSTADGLPYLNAVIKETLRLYAPLPASEPRCYPYGDVEIDGCVIPAGTVVSMSPYSLHRNAEVFPEPLKFDPERWMVPNEAVARWFWAFSSGGRMCIGIHLAMAEMTTLVAAVYRQYTTSLAPGFVNTSPAITSRFELFFDETLARIAVHSCMLSFEKQQLLPN